MISIPSRILDTHNYGDYIKLNNLKYPHAWQEMLT